MLRMCLACAYAKEELCAYLSPSAVQCKNRPLLDDHREKMPRVERGRSFARYPCSDGCEC